MNLSYLSIFNSVALVVTSRSTELNNEPDNVATVVTYLLGLMGDFVKLLQSIYIFDFGGSVADGVLSTVSLFDFLIVLAIMSIVITYLVNVARHPRVEAASDSLKRRKGE